MRFVRPLWDIRPEDLAEAGGKAVGLSRLADLGVEVPPGFVVTASFFDETRAASPLEPEAEALAEKIPSVPRAELESALEALGPSPSGYAVRSSAADEDASRASFAGIHESYLNVARAQVPRFLLRCWASATAPRALAYRRRMGLPAEPSVIRTGAVVQRMLRPSCAGVLFTREPGTAGDQILIQAVQGTAEKLAQGQANPATLRVPRDTFAGTGGHPEGGAFTLSAAQVTELVSLSLRLEAAWGCPLDLEWAEEEGRIYFLQARPISTLGAPGQPEQEEAARPLEDILWTRANLRELLPELPSVLFESLSERVDWALNCRRLGMSLKPGERVVRFIEGRPYFNLSLIGNWMAQFGVPVSHFTRALGHDAEPAVPSGGRVRTLQAFLRSPIKMMRASLLQASTPRRLERFFEAARRQSAALQALDPPALSDAALAAIFEESSRYATELIFHLQLAFNRVSSAALLAEALLPAGAEPEAFLSAVLAAGEKSISVRQGTDLIRLSLAARAEPRARDYLRSSRGDFHGFEEALSGTRFLDDFRAYLKTYGHRGVHESDPAMPVYAQDPGFLLRALCALLSDPKAPDPDATLRAQEETARRAWASMPAWRRFLLRGPVRRLQDAIIKRERTRFEGMRVSAALRRFQQEAGERLARRGHLSSPASLVLLRIEEIEPALLGKSPAEQTLSLVRRRAAQRERQAALPMPNLLRESQIAHLAARAPAAPQRTGEFQGMPVGPGRVEGRAVVLESPHQLEQVRPGDILVTPTLDPSWIPLFTLAAGLVVEMGGTLSHGSIIAREYGLPTIVNIPGIMRRLKTGDRVLLNGSTGLLKVLEGAS